jgi:hypothetical protein
VQQFEHSDYLKSGKVGIAEIGDAVWKSQALPRRTCS